MWAVDPYDRVVLVENAMVDMVVEMVLSPQRDRFLAIHGEGLRVAVYDLDGRELFTWQPEDSEDSIQLAQFTADGESIITVDQYGRGYRHHLTTTHQILFEDPNDPYSDLYPNTNHLKLIQAPDQSYIIIRDHECYIKRWRWDGQFVGTLSDQDGEPVWINENLIIDPSDRYLINQQNYFAIWATTKERYVSDWQDFAFTPEEWEGQLMVDENGRGILICESQTEDEEDHPISPNLRTEFRSLTNELLFTLQGNQDEIYDKVIWTDDRSKLITQNFDKIVVWNHMGEKSALIELDDGYGIRGCYLSPLQDKLFIISDDSHVEAWSLEGVRLALFAPYHVYDIQFSLDGKWLVLICAGGRASICDTSGITFFTIEHIEHEQEHLIEAVTITENNRFALVLYENGAVIRTPLYPSRADKVAIAKQRIQRGFTDEEQARYFRDDPTICPKTAAAVLSLFDE